MTGLPNCLRSLAYLMASSRAVSYTHLQAAEGALVTGQLAVAAGGVGGDPDQGIEPVDGEAEAADQAPEGV